MRIEESGVRLDARHTLAQTHALDIRSSFRSVLRKAEAAAPPATPEDVRKKEEHLRLVMQQLIAAMLEAITGEKCRCGGEEVAAFAADTPAESAEFAAGAPRLRSFEWQRVTIEHIEEHERTDFTAGGTIRTADGRQIGFDLSLDLCRDYSCTRERREQGSVEFHDPLVINFAGTAAQLTDARFNFDLDADGQAESLPVLARGSGYLVLDANGDGRIGDGREVVGARSGEAFADLAKLDADGNGWVDEADPAFAALGVWFPDGRIAPLKEAGVGALHVDSAWSPFALRDADNQPRGQIWRSGVYLNEDGRAGTLQQIDLAAEKN